MGKSVKDLTKHHKNIEICQGSQHTPLKIWKSVKDPSKHRNTNMEYVKDPSKHRNRNMEICQGPQQTRGRGGHRGPLSEHQNRDFTPAKRTFQRNLRGEKERRKERKKEERGDRNRPPTGPHAQDQKNKRVRENPSLRQLFRIFLVSRKRFWLISGAQSQQIGPILCRNGAGPWAHPLARVSASTMAENGRTNGRNRI